MNKFPVSDFCRECPKCGSSNTGLCPAEDEYMARIIKKLDENEMLFITWMLLKARGAGDMSVEQLADAIVDATKKAEVRND